MSDIHVETTSVLCLIPPSSNLPSLEEWTYHFGKFFLLLVFIVTFVAVTSEKGDDVEELSLPDRRKITLLARGVLKPVTDGLK